MRCFYFDCWNTAGHYLHPSPKNDPWPPGVAYDERHRPEYYGNHVHLDGTLAPRRARDGSIVWQGMGVTHEERQRIRYGSNELPQGEFLLHHLDSGYTAIQWWDRTQGDQRDACNSTFLMEGRWASNEMLAALAEHFPSVLANLAKVGVTLQEVTL